MQREIDSEELRYQMAYDLVEADEAKRMTAGGGAARVPAEPQWIDLADPDVYTKLRHRMGFV